MLLECKKLLQFMGYATKFLQEQVEVVQKVDYKFVDTGDSAVTVKYKDHTHNVDTEAGVCSCSFWNTMLLPCRHIIGSHLHKGLCYKCVYDKSTMVKILSNRLCHRRHPS